MNVLQKDSAISSPSTPNSSISSQSTLLSSSCPSPATPTTAITTTVAYQQPTGAVGTPPPQAPPLILPQTPGSSSNSSGHKNSLKGTKLARRARSFKDDLFEKISLMRTANNTLGRSHSPHSPRSKNSSVKPLPTAEEVARSTHTLETHVKDISNALKHFRDVILKKKLEVLPGNGTVILETIASMYAVIQSYTLNENSTVLLSATQQVYQSLGKLIKLCDEVMLSDENGECASLSNDNVREVVDLLEDAVRNLVTLAQQKLKEKEESVYKYSLSSAAAETPSVAVDKSIGVVHHLMRPTVEVAGQRTSLPDITLTPKERDILEKTKSNPIRASHSTESILRDTSPPPKPPLPNRTTDPPPLPPKRRSHQPQQQLLRQQHSVQHQHHSNNISINSDLDCSSDFSLVNYGVDHLSVRSRSPDENSSQCSLDSALNHSREEEELKLLGSESRLDDNMLDDDVDKILYKTHVAPRPTDATSAATRIIANNINDATASVASSGVGGVLVVSGSGGDSGDDGVGGVGIVLAAKNENVAAAAHVIKAFSGTVVIAGAVAEQNVGLVATASENIENENSINIVNNSTEMRKPATTTNNRHSNESGFVSMKSFRTSTQSVSKRSSDYSFQSSTKSSSSNSEITFGANETSAISNGGDVAAVAAHQEELITSRTATKTSINQVAATSTTSSSSLKMFSSSSAIGISSSAISSGNILSSDLSINKLQTISQSLASSSRSTTTTKTATSLDGVKAPPPALPPKTSRHGPMKYDNFDEVDDNNSELPELRQHHLNEPQQYHHLHEQQQHLFQWQSKHQSLIEPSVRQIVLDGSCITISESGANGNRKNLDEPPPLPIKKKHILAYMEICSASTRPIEQHRHTMHSYNLSRNITHSQTMNIMPLTTKELKSSENELPPALPPKNYKPRKISVTQPSIITTPPPSPKPTHFHTSTDSHRDSNSCVLPVRVLSGQQACELMSTVCEEQFLDTIGDIQYAENNKSNQDMDMSRSSSSGGGGSMGDNRINFHHSHNLPNESTATALSDANNKVTDGRKSSPTNRCYSDNDQAEFCTTDLQNEEDEGIDVVLENHNYNKNCVSSLNSLPNMLEELDITPYLIIKKDGEDCPEVKGGYIDALIVHASRVQKVGDNAFSEAFITTFRTFIQPIDVIEKLTHRYTVFFCQMNDQKQKAAKETFSLLVHVVNDLTATDLTSQLLTLLVEFVYQLVCSGQLYLAKLLRNKFVEKVTLYKDQKVTNFQCGMYLTVTNQPTLLDLKSLEIAEQMTLLDAELFQKIEIPEVLLFAKEQCEEKSPNLNKFTEHFNKMSYWARSKILMLSDAKEREKHVIKFIKIMKHLRKMNNYNSYLALLSALDSAPIRRLEWHKTITEGLKEYCTLIDSSSSFRVYRQALAETNPPCIPYIGLVLQDLTFVHVGNPDYLKEGVINFSKRWQQHNIIVNMKRFKKCSYPFRRNERIIRFFENFENFLGEEEMWQISEAIKPRGKRPNNY